MMVHEQELMVETIHGHTEEALLSLERGKYEIATYNESISSNRNLAIKVFLIFVLFFTFYVIFLV
jgi:t-SNARE complex subunit (syntaxin)